MVCEKREIGESVGIERCGTSGEREFEEIETSYDIERGRGGDEVVDRTEKPKNNNLSERILFL